MDDTNLKKLFAAELLKNPENPFAAALQLFGTDTQSAFVAASRWLTDPVVIEEKERLTTEGFDEFLPTKADLALAAWNLTKDPLVRAEDKIKAMRLYGEIRGFIEKPQTTINNNNLTDNRRVMVVHEKHSNLEDWEQIAITQQRAISHASKSN